MGNRQNCAKFQEILFRSYESISIFCPPLFRKRPIQTNTNFIATIFMYKKQNRERNYLNINKALS